MTKIIDFDVEKEKRMSEPMRAALTEVEEMHNDPVEEMSREVLKALVSRTQQMLFSLGLLKHSLDPNEIGRMFNREDFYVSQEVYSRIASHFWVIDNPNVSVGMRAMTMRLSHKKPRAGARRVKWRRPNYEEVCAHQFNTTIERIYPCFKK